ncbi:hypothetical protein DQ238_09125 [Geodermatophilus sp. TF02-6]|nr:hypothetical protein DQ238_09125 [Geodermatophilus sp. TF02-6]
MEPPAQPSYGPPPGQPQPGPQGAAARFNPPPNWPPPPPGWTPPPGWQPDPSWGPAPQGWPLWVTDAPASFGSPALADVPGQPQKPCTSSGGSSQWAPSWPCSSSRGSLGGATTRPPRPRLLLPLPAVRITKPTSARAPGDRHRR